MQTISFCLSSLSTPSDIINRLIAHIMVRTPGKNAVFHNIFFLNTRTSSFNFVSHSPHSLDIFWILRRIIHLIPQMSDVNHNCIRTVHKILFSPHFLKQFSESTTLPRFLHNTHKIENSVGVKDNGSSLIVHSWFSLSTTRPPMMITFSFIFTSC